MRADDAFWAGRIVSKIDEAAIRRILAEADYRAPEAEDHLARMILRRRDKVLAWCFRLTNRSRTSCWKTGRRACGCASPTTGRTGLGRVSGYEYQWFRFDNGSQAKEPLSPPAQSTLRSLPVPADRPEYLMVRIRSLGSGEANAAWSKAVEVYLRTAGQLSVVGIDREP